MVVSVDWVGFSGGRIDWSAGLRIECLRDWLASLRVDRLSGLWIEDSWQNVLGLWIVRSSLSVEGYPLTSLRVNWVVEYEDYTFPCWSSVELSGSTPLAIQAEVLGGQEIGTLVGSSLVEHQVFWPLSILDVGM